MSSTMALPMSLQAAEKNTKNPTLSRVLMPSTVNFHLVGDGIFIPLLAFAVLQNYGVGVPSFEAYFLFSLYFVLAKFSVAAVPGGGIIVMIPLLQKYLGFSTEMLSLMTALYILFDPVITSFNIAGNGAFAIVWSRFYTQLNRD
jgi:Na+/H+-dicarboxylate symporter